jgi:ribosomal protein S18 acetylase RimI-like enzyme
VEIRRVTRDEWEALRDMRLRALADAPDAFATTHAEAMTRPDDWWRDWAQRSAESDTQAMVLAWNDDEPVGLAGVFVLDDGAWCVISMWVDPSARGRGIGRALLDAVVAWARGQDPGRAIKLGVTDGNNAARALYESYGFRDNGVSEPLRATSKLLVRHLELR